MGGSHQKQILTVLHNSMLAQRLIVAILLIPLGIAAIMSGGWVLTITAVVVLGFAAFEYARIFRMGGFHPSVIVLLIGITALVVSRHVNGFGTSDLVLGAVILFSMAAQVVGYEKGGNTSALDFNITLGGVLYIGWLGAYLISVRDLPYGEWWLLLVLPSCWMIDGAAYFVGSSIGKHKMSPRVSPKKTWEGYLGGILFGALGTMFLAYLWGLQVDVITPARGLILGLILAVASPLGDLGESMLKRAFGVKDSGHVLPGHGGILDRVDSWLWAAIISYYLITLAWLS